MCLYHHLVRMMRVLDFEGAQRQNSGIICQNTWTEWCHCDCLQSGEGDRVKRGGVRGRDSGTLLIRTSGGGFIKKDGLAAEIINTLKNEEELF